MRDAVSASRREALCIVGIWCLFAVWVLGYACFHAYVDDAQSIELVLGLPSWVTWGIALPWCVASVVTVVFSLGFMKDE